MPKKPDKDELGTEMEALAVALAKSMAEGKEPAKEVINGFGKLTSYFAATRRLNLKTGKDDEDGVTFSDIRQKLILSTKAEG